MGHPGQGDPPAAGSPATFAFDALGRFKSRTVGATTDTYGYVGQSETTFALAGGASTRLSAFDLGGSRISVKDGSTLGYLVPDLHGSVVATETSGSTAIASALRYDGYGRTAAVALPGGTVALDTRYTGALDLSPDSTPLYDIGARLYSPASGAWTQLDTYGGQAQDPASMNRFLYAHANPTTFIDPTGHRIEGPRSGEYEVGTTDQVIERYQDQTPGAGGGTTGGGQVYRPDPGIHAVPGGGANPPTGLVPTVPPDAGDERLTDRERLHLLWLYSVGVTRMDEEYEDVCEIWGRGIGFCAAPLIDPSSDLAYFLFGDPFRQLDEAGLSGKTIRLLMGPGDDLLRASVHFVPKPSLGIYSFEREGMSRAAREYQARVTGIVDNVVFRVRGIKFDAEGLGRSAAYHGRQVLVDAKSLKAGSKVVTADGRFADFIAKSMERQALRQVIAADGKPIEYWVQSERLAGAWRNLLQDIGQGSRIQVVVVP